MAKALDRSINYETYIQKMNVEELIGLIDSLENLDEVTTALTELAIRDKELAKFHSLKILESDMGDEFLQAMAFNLLYEADNEKAKETANSKLTKAPAALLGAIMDSLASDSLQPFGKSLSPSFLKTIQQRYLELTDSEKKRISENYDWFKESFEEKLK